MQLKNKYHSKGQVNKKGLKQVYQQFLVWLGVLLASRPVWADLPQEPHVAGENSGDYIKVGVSLADEALSAFLNLLFVGSIIGYCIMVFILIRHAREKHEWSPMIIGSGIGLGALVIVLILLNIGKKAIGTS